MVTGHTAPDIDSDADAVTQEHFDMLSELAGIPEPWAIKTRAIMHRTQFGPSFAEGEEDAEWAEVSRLWRATQ